MHSIMANQNLGQDVANNSEENWQLLIYCGQILFPYSKLQECVVTVLLLTSIVYSAVCLKNFR